MNLLNLNGSFILYYFKVCQSRILIKPFSPSQKLVEESIFIILVNVLKKDSNNQKKDCLNLVLYNQKTHTKYLKILTPPYMLLNQGTIYSRVINQYLSY